MSTELIEMHGLTQAHNAVYNSSSTGLSKAGHNMFHGLHGLIMGLHFMNQLINFTQQCDKLNADAYYTNSTGSTGLPIGMSLPISWTTCYTGSQWACISVSHNKLFVSTRAPRAYQLTLRKQLLNMYTGFTRIECNSIRFINIAHYICHNFCHTWWFWLNFRPVIVECRAIVSEYILLSSSNL